MINNHLLKTIILVLLSLTISVVLVAQKAASITGKIIDAQTSQSLPGANVFIESINLGVSTDLDGGYQLGNIPAGTYSINITYLGYEDLNQEITLTAGEVLSIDFSLKSIAILGEEIVITAQAAGQRAAINQQLASTTIANIVSAEKMLELPDANAAEAIGRLPGISLQREAGEANKVVVRGLSPKYNVVTLEGLKIPSTSDLDRSVDLSILPSELLNSIEVIKSLRADMDADALGGTVNMRISAAPEERKIIGVLEGGYADITNDFSNYRAVGGISDRVFNKRLGVSAKLSVEQKQLPSQQFSGGYSGPAWNFITDSDGIIVDSSLFVRTQSTGLIDRDQRRRRTNASLTLDYKTSWWDVKLLNVYSQKNDFITTRTNTYLFNVGGNPANFSLDLNETDWKTDIRMHSLINDFRFGNTSLTFTLSTTYAEQTQSDQNFPFIEVNTYGLDQNSLVYRQPTSIINEVGGPSSLIVGDTYLRQLGIGSRELIDENYDARLDYEVPYRFSNSISGKLKLGAKYHELTRTSNGTSLFSNFEFGGGVGTRQALIEQFPWIETNLGAQRGINAINFVDESYDPDEFLNGRFDLGWSADIDLLTDIQDQFFSGEIPDPNYFLRGVPSFVRDYEATEQLSAAYLMTEVKIGQDLMVMPGLRFERNETEYFAFHIKTNSGQSGIEPNPDSVTTNRINDLWFPSLNLKYQLSDAIILQGAVYRSASRPSFREISPLVIYPTNNNFIQSNNPFLEPSTAWNFDLGFSYNTNRAGLFTVYGFYKEIDDLIFSLNGYRPRKKGDIVGGPAGLDDRILGAEYYDEFFLDQNGQTDLPINNSEKAYVTGLELSWQTSFWYLPGLWKGLVLDINYTLLDTRTKYPYFQQVQIGLDSSGFIPQPIFGQEYRTRAGQMQDQPTSILNIILGWDYKGFSSRLSYRFQSQTVQSLDSRFSLFDSFYDNFSLFDFTLKQKINKHIAAYINFKNIGRQIDDFFFAEQEENPALPTSSQAYGRFIQFGARLNF